MKKFFWWATSELQYVATLIAGRDMQQMVDGENELYNQVIREIRNRRIHDELQTKLNLEGQDNP